MSNEIKRMEFTIHGDNFSRIGEVAGKINRLLQNLGFPRNLVRRAALGVYEAETNVIIHSLGGGSLVLEIHPNLARIVVQDRGPGILDVKKALQTGWTTVSEEARRFGFGNGNGLPNMMACADSFAIEAAPGGGTCITMEFVHK